MHFISGATGHLSITCTKESAAEAVSAALFQKSETLLYGP